MFGEEDILPWPVINVYNDYTRHLDDALKAIKRAVRVKNSLYVHECFRSIVFLLKVYVLPLEVEYSEDLNGCKKLSTSTVNALMECLPSAYAATVNNLRAQCEANHIDELIPPFDSDSVQLDEKIFPREVLSYEW